MKIRTLILAASAALGAPPGEAQIRIGQDWWTSGVTVRIQDGVGQGLILSRGTKTPVIVLPGQFVDVTVGGGILAPAGEVNLGVGVCSGVVTGALPPPHWTTDPSIVGMDTIPELLPETMSERALGGMVDRTKKRLDRRKVLGRDDMKRDLDRWFKYVRKHGQDTTSCRHPIKTVVSRTVRVYDHGYKRAEVWTVRQRGQDRNEQYYIESTY